MSSITDLLSSRSNGSVMKEGGLAIKLFAGTFKFVRGNKKSKYGFI